MKFAPIYSVESWLNHSTTYHYRLVAVNEIATSYGEDATLESK